MTQQMTNQETEARQGPVPPERAATEKSVIRQYAEAFLIAAARHTARSSEW